jgi:NAD(P)-dependent dehydrogenase (short-subunit alcohol dehydrogenase family)
LGPRKIRVNAIAPGEVETEGTHSAGVIGSGFERAMIASTPLGRIGQPDEIAFRADATLLKARSMAKSVELGMTMSCARRVR